MDEIFDSDLARSIREKVDLNLRMVILIAPTSEEPADSLLVDMNGVLRTLATGQMSFGNTHASLSTLLIQLQAKISEDSADSCHAVSLVTFTKIFAVGMENVLLLLMPKDQQGTLGAEGMNGLMNSQLSLRLREKLDSNIQMIGRIAQMSEQPIDSLLISMVDVLRTLTGGAMSKELTRPSLFYLLVQLHAKISVDYADSSLAVSLVAFTKVFFVGIERVLPLLPKVEVEDPAPNNAGFSNPLPPPLAAISQQEEQNDMTHSARETMNLEEPEDDEENNEADTMPAVGEKESVDQAEESDANSVMSSSDLAVSSLESEDSGSSPGREWVSDSEEEPTKETTEHFGRSAKSATDQESKDPPVNSAAKEPKVPELIVPEERGPLTSGIVKKDGTLISLVPDDTPPPVDTSHVSPEGDNTPTELTGIAVSALQMPTPQQQEPDIRMESTGEAFQVEEQEGVDSVRARTAESYQNNDFIDNLDGGMGEEVAASPPLISASCDIRAEFRRHVRSLGGDERQSDFSLEDMWGDDTTSQEDDGRGEAETDTGMADSEMMEMDESDSSSGSDSGSEYAAPTAKKRFKLPVKYNGTAQTQRQKRRPLKRKAHKTLPKRSRRESKEDETEGAESAEDGEEVDITSGSTGDKRKCSLCGTRVESCPSVHIARFHLKKHRFTCPVCIVYGDTLAYNVSRHMRAKHPSDVDKQPVSHLAEHSTELQRLQEICFPALNLRAARHGENAKKNAARPANSTFRANCMVCNEKVANTNRRHHVFLKHFKKAGLFECPHCPASSSTFTTVTAHIKAHHQTEYGSVHPVSHEEEYAEEIADLNQKCFPGWQRQKVHVTVNRERKRAAQKDDYESEEKNEAEEEEISSGMEESEWKGAPTKNGKQTQAIKNLSKRRMTEEEEEEEEKMEEGEGGSKGRL